MKLSGLFNWLYQQIYNYNLFIPDVVVNDGDEGDNNIETQDPAVSVKRQKQATWLYILLLIISLYILFYITIIKPQSQTITITNITPEIFNGLYRKHASTLSCPCSSITIPYKDFVSSTIVLHPICSSLFVSEQWINALYLTDSSVYAVSDFRTTASYQFQLLASLCSLSEKIINENQMNFDYDELVAGNLLPQEQIQSEVNASAEFLKSSLSIRLISFLNYFRTTIQANYLISALNTNAVIQRLGNVNEFIVTALRTAYYRSSSVFDPITAPVCGVRNPTSPASFFSFSIAISYPYSTYWGTVTTTSVLVNGFSGSCTPLEAVLVSTLDCLYDAKCLQKLVNYFPILNQTRWNSTNYVLLSTQMNISVYNYLNDLFIKEWTTEINYTMYFNKCTPSFCTYTTIDDTNFVNAVALLISLWGGLIIILRLIVPLFINILSKFRCHSITDINVRKKIQSLKRLNLFKRENNRTEADIKKQIITTRIYLILGAVSFIILLLFTSLRTQTNTITVLNPSLNTYNELENVYSDTLVCPCSNITISFRAFISLLPTFHQVCSSDFVREAWLTILKGVMDQTVTTDWLSQAVSQFRLLSDLCQLANKTIDDAIHRFMVQSFISSTVLIESDVNTQMNATLNQLFQSTTLYFGFVVDTIGLLAQIDQPYMGKSGNPISYFQTNVAGNMVTNVTNGQQSMHFNFFFTGTRNINTTTVDCICATNPYCQSPVAIYNVDFINNDRYNFTVAYMLPGFVGGCSMMDSLLGSTLECFYSDSQCFSIVMNYTKQAYIQSVEYPSWFDMQPLVYNPILTRFLSNTTIRTLMKELMIEKWNPTILYAHYYQACLPNYCTYSKKMRTSTIISVITVFMSTLSGLCLSLRLITPILVKLIYVLMRLKNRRQQVQVNMKWSDRVKTVMKRAIIYLYTKILDLNIFHVTDFRSDIDRMKAINLGRWATRLFICLFSMIIAIFALYTVIRPETLKKTFPKPSLQLYNQLKRNYEDRLKCPCSLVASKYEKFVKIESIMHQICLSSFATDEWRFHLTTGLVSNLSIYHRKDYRRFLSAHLQMLTGLCQFSSRSVNDTINQFLSSLFITDQLLSEEIFYTRINSSIERTIANAPVTLTRLLFLLRSINHGNAIMSQYGTNFEHIIPVYQLGRVFAQTQAIIYDENCSCGLYPSCTSQAYFIQTLNSSNRSPIKGMKIGCTPSESFRASTLECFYDNTCINLLGEYTNFIDILHPLSTTMSRFSINTTVAELIDDVFVDEWLTTMNYSSYFEHCSPLFCSYTYTQRLNSLYTITLLLGLQGGLSIALKWICPILVQIIFKIDEYRKKKKISIQPVCAIELTPNSSNSTNTDSLNSDIELITASVMPETKVVSSIQCSLKMIFICILLLITTVTLILFSIYFIQQEKIQTTVSSTSLISTDMNTNITTLITTSTTTSSSSTVSSCQLTFQKMIAYVNKSYLYANSPVVHDLNNDGHLDITFFQPTMDKMNVLLGYGNGTFQPPMSFSTNCPTYLSSIVVNDINNDGWLDFVGSCENLNLVSVFFQNANGTFRTPMTLSTGNDSKPKGIAIADFNSDGYLDIAVAQQWSNRIGLFLGNNNGTFAVQTTFSTGRNSFPRLIAIADFDVDNHLDMAVINYLGRNIGLFRGNGDGTFQEQKTFFTGGGPRPYYFGVGDFNNDNQVDIFCSYYSASSVGMLFGYGNGTFNEIKKYPLKPSVLIDAVVVADMNGDGHLDIIIGISTPYTINIIFIDSNGNFETQTIFSATGSVSQLGVTVSDLNGDGYQDIIATPYQGYTVDVFLNTGACSVTKTP